MATIRFYVSYKRDVLEWHRIWGSERHRRAGNIFGLTASVEPATIGDTMTLMVEPEFIRFLKTKNIPFEVVSEAVA
jgi:hypothetical protein